jgi:hypothetical protein
MLDASFAPNAATGQSRGLAEFADVQRYMVPAYKLHAHPMRQVSTCQKYYFLWHNHMRAAHCFVGSEVYYRIASRPQRHDMCAGVC